MKVEIASDIAAPPHIVYAVIIDISRWPHIMRAIEQLDLLTPGPVGVGTRFRETRTMFGRTATEEMTVVALDPPHCFDLSAENHGTRYRARHEIETTPIGSRLRLVFEGVPVSLSSKLFSWIGYVMAGAVKRQLQSDLDGVKAEAERRAKRGPCLRPTFRAISLHVDRASARCHRPATYQPSAADLTFLSALPQVLHRNVKSQAALESFAC